LNLSFTRQDETPATASSFTTLLLAVAILLLPILLPFWVQRVSAKISTAAQKHVWARFRGFGRLVLTAAVAGRWAIWGSRGLSAFVSRFCSSGSGLPEPVACAPLLYSAPPVVSPGIFLVTCCAINTLKSGELRYRALLLAEETGITLQRVFIVPSGKGHLTNAFGMSSAIGLTDNLGKYLTKEQVHSKNRGYRLGRTRASRTLNRHPRGRRGR